MKMEPKEAIVQVGVIFMIARLSKRMAAGIHLDGDITDGV